MAFLVRNVSISTAFLIQDFLIRGSLAQRDRVSLPVQIDIKKLWLFRGR